MRRSVHFAVAMLAGGSALAIAIAAQAQTAPAASADEVVVTGSRVIKNGNNSPTPVTVAPAQDLLETQPTTIADALNTLPMFGGGSQTSTSGPGSGVRNGAASFINLRNAGDNHTLVLLDGARVAPSNPQSTQGSDVDINLLPQMLLQRVDIVTGGASAVYGSDAIAGVVNFITDTHFNGLKLNVSGGESTYGDDPIYDVGIAAGRTLFGGRGHLEASFEYHNDAGILDPTDKAKRPLFGADLGGGGAGTAASPYVLVPNETIGNTAFGGKITSATGSLAALNNMYFGQNGVMSPFVNGAAVAGSSTIQSGGDGAYYYNSSIKSSLIWRKFFGRFDYDITDTIHGFLQEAWSWEQSAAYYQSPNVTFNVSTANPYLQNVTTNSSGLSQAQFQALLAANPTGSFRMGEFLLETELNHPIVSTMNFNMFNGGLDGSLGAYKWQIHFGHQWYDNQVENEGDLNLGRFYAAVDSTTNSSGQIICRASLTNTAYSNCVPLNPFGPTAASQAAINYVDQATSAWMHVQEDEVQSSISGSPFSTWAGPVDTALSFEYHRIGYNLVSNAQPADDANCNGILFSTLSGTAVTGNCNGPNTTSPTATWGQANTLTSLNPGVAISTTEGAGEANVPLVKDEPFVKNLDVNLAARYSDYNTGISAWTWKVGLNWQLNDEWRLRATTSHDIRAPNLYELYSPPAYTNQSFQDFVVNGVGTTQTGTVPMVKYSSTSLQPELSNTVTAGFVYVSKVLPGFSASVDAYRIMMSNTIIQIRAIDQPVINSCIASGGTSPYCSWYIRPTPTSFPTLLLSYIANIASQDTYGADFEANYAGSVFDHRYTLRALVNYQPHNVFVAPTGTVDVGDAAAGGPNGVGPSPSIRGTVMGTFKLTDAWSLDIMERWRNSMIATGVTTPLPTAVYANDVIPGIAYTNLTLSYTFKRGATQVELYGNIQNLFNAFPSVPVGGAPSSIPDRGNTPLPAGDDPVGRFYMMGLRLRM